MTDALTTPMGLTDLAGAAGLLVNWRDASGAAKMVSPESLRAVLAALDLPAGTNADIAESRARLASERESRDFLTADASTRVDIPGARPGRAARLLMEDGEVATLAPIPTAEGLSCIAPDRPGYHRLDLGDREITLAVAPPKAFTVEDAARGRGLWGTAVQIYSLRDNRAEAFGDFGALARFATAAGRRGAGALAISPVHALFFADDGRYSPYAPSTRLFLNGLFADPAAVFGETGGGR